MYNQDSTIDATDISLLYFLSTDGVTVYIAGLAHARDAKSLLINHVNDQLQCLHLETLTGADVNGRLKPPGISSIYHDGYENFPWALPARARHDSHGKDAVLVSLLGLRRRKSW